MTPEDVAKLLVRIGAVEVRCDPNDWFVWSSGRRAPIYCDNRRTLGFPEDRKSIADALASAITDAYAMVETIAGTATAGIGWAALVGERLGLPMVYVRSAAKEHGQQRQVEGKLDPKTRVVLVEDLISLGGSAGNGVTALRNAGTEVLGIQSIFSYGLPEAVRRFAGLEVRARALSDFDALLATLTLSEEQARALHEWRAR